LLVSLERLDRALGRPDPPGTSEWADDRTTVEWRFRDRDGARWVVYDFEGSADQDRFTIGGEGFMARPPDPELFREFLQAVFPEAVVSL